jgi:uncharacterized protein (TIGR01777 family)
MKILLTGGTGLLGQCFVQEFGDYQFTVLTRSCSKAKSLFPETVTLIDSLDRLQNLDEFDAVINLAGEAIIDKRWSEQQKNVICQSRWKISQQLVDLFSVSLKPPAVFLSGSAVGIYGDRGSEIISESAVLQENDFATRLCIRWEEIAKQATPFTRVVFLRTGIVLALQGGALQKMLLPFKLCLGGRIATGQQYMSWIHYLDHINAMDFLLKNESLAGAVNLVAPEPKTNQDFTKALATSLHRPAIIPAPKKILQLLLGESSSLLLDSQRIVPQALLDKGFKFSFSSLESALGDLLKA